MPELRAERARPRQELVLIVEDDASLRLGLTKTLRSADFRVVSVATGTEALAAVANERPDLILLDIMLPGKNGFAICEEVRTEDPDIPIIILTAKGEEEDRVRGLLLGADDYVVKPFGVAELLARIAAALRRRRLDREATERVSFGDISVDFSEHSLLRAGTAVEVTTLEMKLLRYFIEHEDSLLPRQRILNAVWGSDYFGTDRTVDNFVTRLRAKIEADPKNPRHIQTLRGSGYRFSRKPK